MSDHAFRDSVVSWSIGPVLLILAVWFFAGSGPADVPIAERATFDHADITTDPLRPSPTDRPTIDVAGFTKKCTECHSLFRLDRTQPLVLSQHRNIVQGHGMNDRCFNCHDDSDPSRLVLPGGETVSFADSVRLCATCHGTTFRDWEMGIHGRTIGSWDRDDPAYGRLTCTNCHDAHAPALGPMSLLPGPNTLRLDEPPASSAHHGPRNPLRQWSDSNKEDHH